MPDCLSRDCESEPVQMRWGGYIARTATDEI